MHSKRRIVQAFAVAIIAAAPAGAQQFLYYNACGFPDGSALRVCASADVFLSGSTLTMRVWNMEVDGASGMSSYASEFGGWHTITSVGLDHRNGNRTGSGALSSARYIFGSGENDFTALSYWQGVDDGAVNPLRVELGSTTDGHREGIVGCTDPGPERAGHVRTCGGYGFMPYAEFTFSQVDPRIYLGAYNFEFYGWQIAGNQTAKVSASGVPTEVVPEPVTMVLLGSGLLGIGGAGLRRRRRIGGEVDETV